MPSVQFAAGKRAGLGSLGRYLRGDDRGVRVSLPPAVLQAQRGQASDVPLPVVSLAGPTGAGKSFVASSFVAAAGASRTHLSKSSFGAYFSSSSSVTFSC